MQIKFKLLTIELAVITALALQVGELHAFDSPVERPAPPRPMPPCVEPERKSKPSGHPRQSESEQAQPTLTLASVDGMGLLWAMAVGE